MRLSSVSSANSFGALYATAIVEYSSTVKNILKPVERKLTKLASNVDIHLSSESIPATRNLGLLVEVRRFIDNPDASLQALKFLLKPSNPKKDSKILYKTVKHFIKLLK